MDPSLEIHSLLVLLRQHGLLEGELSTDFQSEACKPSSFCAVMFVLQSATFMKLSISADR